MAADAISQHNMHTWIEENRQFFAPPVCNKLMYKDGQLKVMFVGGPNTRKDYHIESGEEVKGDMVVKIMERGQPKDVHIREGEVFVLPGRIPHSPQRFADTVGLVIERLRHDDEKDALRYYCPSEPTKILWEKWFYCEDLGVQLPPVMKEYFASKEHQSGEPSAESVNPAPPLDIDVTTVCHEPFSLKKWVDDHAAEIAKGPTAMFDAGEFKVHATGTEASGTSAHGETLLWQFSGTATVDIDGKSTQAQAGDYVLVKQGQTFHYRQHSGSVGLTIAIVPKTN